MPLRVPKHISLADLMEFFIRQTGSGENIYYCPYCPITNRDKTGHLYINVLKGVGECKKCASVVILTMDASRIDQELKALGTAPLAPEGGDYDIMGIDVTQLIRDMKANGFDRIDDKDKHPYLDDRSIPSPIARICHVGWRRHDNTYCFPTVNPYNNKTFSGWALRHSDGQWHESKSAKKNLYIPHGSICKSAYIVVVEGRSDALSLFARGFPGVAVAGSEMMHRQVIQLAHIEPLVIDVFFDADAQDRSLRVVEAIKTHARTRFTQKEMPQINQVYYPGAKDPAMMHDDTLQELLGVSISMREEEPPAGV